MSCSLRLLLAVQCMRFASADPHCCWSKWGDQSTCGTYTGPGGKCNTDPSKTCSSSTDCPATPAPAPPPPSPTPPSPPAPPTPGSSGQCCWSKWGSSCGGYPAGGSGGLCNQDFKTKCSGNGDCKSVPPAPPSPPPTPPTPPTPPSPPTPPTPPSPPAPPAPPGPSPPMPQKGSPELLGWLENWGPDIKWWDNNMPGNCLMGCFKAEPYLAKIAPYSSVNYGFAFLTKTPDPDQVGCGTDKPEGPCPVWDGENVYLAKAAMQGSVAVSDATTIEEASPSIVAIAEVVRMARMHPAGPKRAKITLGGWSDYARMGSAANGAKVAKLMAKLVAYTFADGVDIDMEHLTPYARMGDEFGAFASFVTTLRSEFTNVAANWKATAAARQKAMSAAIGKLAPWQRKEVAAFYNTTHNYLNEVIANGPPHLEISWTTRFNAFLPPDDVWNYLMPDSPKPNSSFSFETDNEGQKLWPQVGGYIDTVNIMAYDAGSAAGPLKLNFTTILDNFAKYGKVHNLSQKVNMGFEPGEQSGAGVWEGEALDEATAHAIKLGTSKAGGVAIWAVNPGSTQHPQASKDCPTAAKAMNGILEPGFAFGPVPKYTKCGSDGMWPGLSTEIII